MSGDHAAAVVDNQADGDGYVDVAEEGNLLRQIVFDDLKDLLRKIRDSIRVPIEYIDMQNDQVGNRLEDWCGGRIILTRQGREDRRRREQQQGGTDQQRFHL